MTVTKEVIFVAKEDSIEELKGLLAMMVEPSRAEDGCHYYYINQMIQKPTTFVVFEQWRDEAALEGHRHTAHYHEYKNAFEQYTAEKFSYELMPI